MTPENRYTFETFIDNSLTYFWCGGGGGGVRKTSLSILSLSIVLPI